MQAIAIASAGGLGRPGLELRLEENLMGGTRALPRLDSNQRPLPCQSTSNLYFQSLNRARNTA